VDRMSEFGKPFLLSIFVNNKRKYTISYDRKTLLQDVRCVIYCKQHRNLKTHILSMLTRMWTLVYIAHRHKSKRP